MTSLYKQSIPVLIKYLHNLSGILKKSAEWATENGMTHEKMLSAQLAEDQKPLPFQVQSCSNTAKNFAVRMGGIADTYLEDNESTFPELQARITRTIEILQTVDAAAMDPNVDREVLMQTKSAKFRFETGQRYVSEFMIPNFHFHLCTAYSIVRHLGVPVGAMDYLAGVFEKVD